MGEIRPHSLGWTLCELYSIQRINPYNWTFPNCNISFIMDQSTNKTANEWLLQVAYGKICSTLGALLLAWQKKKKKHSVGCTKSKDRHTVGRSCLFWKSVFATICPLKNLPNFRHFDDVVLTKKKLHQLLLVCLLLCFLLLLLLSVYFSCTWRRQFTVESTVFHCFLVFRRIGEYISLVLFYQFCHHHQ